MSDAVSGSREPSRSVSAKGFNPGEGDCYWLHRFAGAQTDTAVECAAKAIAPLILENFDGEPYGSVKWDRIPSGDRDIIRVIARRAMQQIVTQGHVYAQGIEAQRAETVQQGSACESPVGSADAPKS